MTAQPTPEGVKVIVCPPQPNPHRYTALPRGVKLRQWVDPDRGAASPTTEADVYRAAPSAT
jgi:hypothetical protein